MWRRKTIDEKDAEARKRFAKSRKLALPAVSALGVATLFAFVIALNAGGRRGRPNPPLNFAEGWHRFEPAFLIIFPLSFAYFVYARRRDWNKRDATAYICTRCYFPQRPSPTGCIKCGQPLEPLEDWGWVDDA